MADVRGAQSGGVPLEGELHQVTPLDHTGRARDLRAMHEDVGATGVTGDKTRPLEPA
jgi:hypothetical protein